MTSELRPAALVAHEVCEEMEEYGPTFAERVVKADREAVRAEQAAELAKFKALADALASDIRNALSCTPIVRDGKIIYDCGNPWEILSAALRQYKEARDETSTL